MLLKLALVCLLGLTVAQDYDEYRPRPAPARISTSSSEPKPTPIPILKQINRHNEDGSYTYGYEGADGSFKIETKLATGEVKGKYGYVEESGKVRVVEYGANKYGFQPVGEGITVAPPTLVDESTDKNGQQIDYEDEQGQQHQHQHQQQPQHKFVSRIQRPQPPPNKIHRPPPPQHQPQYNQYETEEEEPQQQQHYTGPTPPRPQFANAAPIDVVYSSRPRPARPGADYSQTQNFLPSPPQREQQYSSRAHQAPPPPQQQQISYSQPRAAPVPQPQSNYRPQPQHFPTAPQSRNGGSVLDQLAKDYALPQDSAPALHDITYSYY